MWKEILRVRQAIKPRSGAGLVKFPLSRCEQPFNAYENVAILTDSCRINPKGPARIADRLSIAQIESETVPRTRDPFRPNHRVAQSALSVRATGLRCIDMRI